MKHLYRFTVLAAALAVAAASQAQILNVQGNATGTFNLTSGTEGPGGISYTPGAFNTNVLTNGTTMTGLSGGQLGTFSLANTNQTYAGSFELAVAFLVPTTTPGGTTFTANVVGSVVTGIGGTTITFANTSQSFSYLAANGTKGTLTLNIDPTYTFGLGTSSNNLGGGLKATAVPGPSALASFGLMALGGVRRRRRAAK